MSHKNWTTLVANKPKQLQDDYKQQQQQKQQQQKQQQKSQAPAEAKKAKKAEDEEEDFRQDKIGRKFCVALQQARLQKGWKQEQLAHVLNVNKNVINQYESGKAIPDPSLISKMNRALGVNLPAVVKPKKEKK